MVAWIIDENEDPYTYLEKYIGQIIVGDTIEVIPNNQLGYKKYRVVLGEEGKKTLCVIADWFIEMYE
jgi:hypothetical protein